MAFVFTQAFYDSEQERILRLARGRDLHVFGYGSLMWAPEGGLREPRLARVFGYSRSLSVYSTRYRGTPGRPGLVFGLDRGGSCWGKIYSVRGADRDEMIRSLFKREMFAGVYEARFVRAHVSPERCLEALTFVVRRDHENYAGSLGESEQIRLIAEASGERGSCAEYLLRTQEHLEEGGVPCPNLARLLARLDAFCSVAGRTGP